MAETHGNRMETHACDLISRAEALNLVKDVCEAILSGCGSHYDGEDEVYDNLLEVDAILKCNKEIRTALRHLPSAQSTIYGYDIDCLQLIAYLMREKGITPEEAVTRFVDYAWMAEWIRSQVLSEIGREIKEQCGIG